MSCHRLTDKRQAIIKVRGGGIYLRCLSLRAVQGRATSCTGKRPCHAHSVINPSESHFPIQAFPFADGHLQFVDLAGSRISMAKVGCRTQHAKLLQRGQMASACPVAGVAGSMAKHTAGHERPRRRPNLDLWENQAPLSVARLR